MLCTQLLLAMVSTLSACVEEQVAANARAAPKTIVEVDPRARSVEADVGSDIGLRALRLEPATCLLCEDADLMDHVLHHVGVPWLQTIGPIFLHNNNSSNSNAFTSMSHEPRHKLPHVKTCLINPCTTAHGYRDVLSSYVLGESPRSHGRVTNQRELIVGQRCVLVKATQHERIAIQILEEAVGNNALSCVLHVQGGCPLQSPISTCRHNLTPSLIYEHGS